MELSKKREVFPDLAPILWHSVGTMSALLQVRNGLDWCCIRHLSRQVSTYVSEQNARLFFCAGDRRHLSYALAAHIDGAGEQPCVQCPGAAAMRGITHRNQSTLPAGPHPYVPLSVPQYSQ